MLHTVWRLRRQASCAMAHMPHHTACMSSLSCQTMLGRPGLPIFLTCCNDKEYGGLLAPVSYMLCSITAVR